MIPFVIELIDLPQFLESLVKIGTPLRCSNNQESLKLGIFAADTPESATVQFVTVNIVTIASLEPLRILSLLFNFTCFKLKRRNDIQEYLGVAIPTFLWQSDHQKLVEIIWVFFRWTEAIKIYFALHDENQLFDLLIALNHNITRFVKFAV